MDNTKGTCVGQQPRYQQLLDRAGKGLEELGTSLNTCEERLHIVLEKDAPSSESNGPAEVQKELAPQCELEALLLNLCHAIELRLCRIQNINSRIQI